MPKRIGIIRRCNSIVFCAVLAVSGCWFLIGASATSISESENRVLARMPSLTTGNMFDGVFADGVEAYVADHFPMRESLMSVNFGIRESLGIKSGELTVYDIDVGEGGIDENDEMETQADDKPLLQASAAQMDEGSPGEKPAKPAPAAPEPSLTDDSTAPASGKPVKSAADTNARYGITNGIMIYRGRALQMFGGPPKGSPGWAQAVNAYRKALPAGVRVYGIIVPSAAEFYATESARRRSKPEKPNIDASYAMLDPGVIAVPAHAELSLHVDEPIYLRTDHHWSGLGAYYAYKAFCKSAGLTPVELSSMEKRTKKGWLGSLYMATRDKSLRDNRDDVDYWVPNVQVTVTQKSSPADRGKQIPLLQESSRGYGVFLGGDRSLTVMNTSVRNGRKAVLLKNSYGNPFAVFLASSFEEVYVVDYRYYSGSVARLVADMGVTDVIVLNGSFSANTPYHYKRVERALKGAPKQPKPFSPVP